MKNVENENTPYHTPYHTMLCFLIRTYLVNVVTS